MELGKVGLLEDHAHLQLGIVLFIDILTVAQSAFYASARHQVHHAG